MIPGCHDNCDLAWFPAKIPTTLNVVLVCCRLCMNSNICNISDASFWFDWYAKDEEERSYLRIVE